MVDLGLKDAGYIYVNIDDCWSLHSRDNTTQRIVPDPDKFPDGISGTAEKIHAMGLKLGIYSDAGTLTCAGYPGSLGYEQIDAQTWEEWGVDYLKYDNCNVPSNWTDKVSPFMHAISSLWGLTPGSINTHLNIGTALTRTKLVVFRHLRAMIGVSQIPLSGTHRCVMPCWTTKATARSYSVCATGAIRMLSAGEMRPGKVGGCLVTSYLNGKVRAELPMVSVSLTHLES
jgi:hypothetical protein